MNKAIEEIDKMIKVIKAKTTIIKNDSTVSGNKGFGIGANDQTIEYLEQLKNNISNAAGES